MRCSRSLMAVRTRVRGTGDAQRALMTEQARSAEPHGRGGGERDGRGEAAALGEEDLGEEQDEESGGPEQSGEGAAQGVGVPHGVHLLPFRKRPSQGLSRPYEDAHGTPFVIHDDRMRSGCPG